MLGKTARKGLDDWYQEVVGSLYGIGGARYHNHENVYMVIIVISIPFLQLYRIGVISSQSEARAS